MYVICVCTRVCVCVCVYVCTLLYEFCHLSVQNPMSAGLLSKPKDGNNRTIILPAVLYGCNIWTLMLREVFRLKLFEKRLLSKIFGSKGDEVTGDVMRLHDENCMICVPLQILCKNANWARRAELMTERRDSLWVWYGNLRQRDHFEDLGVDGKIILKLVFTK